MLARRASFFDRSPPVPGFCPPPHQTICSQEGRGGAATSDLVPFYWGPPRRQGSCSHSARTCFAGKVCGPVRSTWGTSLGEDRLVAGARILNTMAATLGQSGHAPGGRTLPTEPPARSTGRTPIRTAVADGMSARATELSGPMAQQPPGTPPPPRRRHPAYTQGNQKFRSEGGGVLSSPRNLGGGGSDNGLPSPRANFFWLCPMPLGGKEFFFKKSRYPTSVCSK